MRSDFEPIYLQDAKRHIEWLYDKLKESKKDKEIISKKRDSYISKLLEFLKRVF